MLYVLDLLATTIFALTGACAARKLKASYLGICLSALLPAVAGGTMREFLLRSDTIFWLQDVYYAVMIALGVILASLHRSHVFERKCLPEAADCLASSVFILVGISAAINAQCNWLFVPFMGVLTALGGGIIRDVVFGGHSKIVMNEKLTRLVFLVASAATIALYFNIEPVIVLTGSLLVQLGCRLPSPTIAAFSANILPERGKLELTENPRPGNSDNSPIYKLRRKQFSKQKRFRAAQIRMKATSM